MRIMYDGINNDARYIHDHFPAAEMVAYYIDGPEAWTAEEIALFPHAVHVEISVMAASGIGHVLDIENGDATPDEFAAWIALRKRAGLDRPSGYCSLSVVPAVRQATGRYILGTDYDLWVAEWTGYPHQVTAPPPGAQVTVAAVQYQSQPDDDITAVYDDGWPHLAPVPAFGFTPWQYLNVSWPAGRDIILQVRDQAGEVLTEQTGVTGHWQTAAFTPGACEVRAQYPGGAWSQWRSS